MFNQRFAYAAALILAITNFAYADVDLYGRVSVGVENDSYQNVSLPSDGSIQDFGSYLGIKGVNPVIGNTSIVWQVEQLLNVTSAQPYSTYTANGLIAPNSNNTNTGHLVNPYNTLGSGETYVGINGNFGKTMLGNLSNYNRSSMNSVDLYNYADGANGLAVYSRTSMLLPTSLRYDSPSWHNLSLSAMYSFQNSGETGLTGIGTSNSIANSGNYSGGIYNFGVAYVNGYFSAKISTQINQQVGAYTGFTPVVNGATYTNAYANRLELGYNQQDGWIVGGGLQATSGYGYWGWANSGGSMNNYTLNPKCGNIPGLNSNQYQTLEAATSVGYHLGQFTPKIGYAYGSNMMYGGNVFAVATGSANQITNSGYQQIVAELDWNITSHAMMFVNYGQIWWGNTMQNIAYNGYNSQGTAITPENQAFLDQSSAAVGLSYTF